MICGMEPLLKLSSSPTHTHPWRAHLYTLLICAGITLLTMPLHDMLDLANIVMLFLLTVAAISAFWGRSPGIFAAIYSVALFDFFFVPPRFSFTVSNAQYLVTFAVMLVVACLISYLTDRVRQQSVRAQASERQSRALYEHAKILAGALSSTQVLEATQHFLHENLCVNSQLFVPDHNEVLHSVAQQQAASSINNNLAIHGVYATGKTALLNESITDLGCTMLLPLHGSTRMRGVLVISTLQESAETLQQQQPLLEAVASLVCIAIERVHFVEVAQQTQLQITAERLRSSILSALSHDIRTPLTALYGLADSLTLQPLHMPENKTKETAVAIRDQAMRLNNMVTNLLDMAKLHAGNIQLCKEWQPLEEVIGASIKLLGSALQHHTIQVQLPQNLPLLNIDAVLMERVFCNLLENAAKYSPLGSVIELSATIHTDNVDITVHNSGNGFPPTRLSQLFELFERGEPESATPGMGIGLAICRSIVEAHGGTIHATNPETGGAAVTFTLPRGTPPAVEIETDACASGST